MVKLRYRLIIRVLQVDDILGQIYSTILYGPTEYSIPLNIRDNNG